MLQHICMCKEDFIGNGSYCLYKDRCEVNNGGCHPLVRFYYLGIIISIYLFPSMHFWVVVRGQEGNICKTQYMYIIVRNMINKN